MVIVAVPGGLGDFGRLIVDALVETGQHEVYSLTRKLPENVQLRQNSQGQEYNPVVQVDYNDVGQMTALLASKQIHTIVSALNVDFQSVCDAQLRLIEAAVLSKCVQRFAPSEFNVDYDLDDSVLPYPEKRFHVAARRALEKTELEYTYFYPGFFMDYFALPRLQTHMRPLYNVLDLEHNEAAIPGDGTAVIAVTFTKDVAKYVAASLAMEKWPRVSVIIGEELTVNELVEKAQRVSGRKLAVRYDSLVTLKNHEAKLLTGNEVLGSQFEGGSAQLRALLCDLGASIALGAYDIAKAKDAVKLVPLLAGQIGRPVDLETFLREYWGPS